MPTLKLKKEEILNISYIFSVDIPLHLEKNPEASITTKFSFMMNFSKDALSPVCMAIAEASKTKIPEYMQYEKDRKSILERMAEKNKRGESIKTKTGYLISKNNREITDGMLAELDVRYKEAIEKRKSEEKEIEGMLQEEIEITICQTSLLNFPTWLNPQQTKALRPFATETDEEILKLIQ